MVFLGYPSKIVEIIYTYTSELRPMHDLAGCSLVELTQLVTATIAHPRFATKKRLACGCLVRSSEGPEQSVDKSVGIAADITI